MCQHSQHKFQNNDECSIENHGWTSISTFIIIILRQKHFLLKNLGSLSPIIVSSLYCIIGLVISTMASKFKGIYKSFKYITQMFAVKERELEIGYPTDVKHVAHIGWDGPSGNGPSWMNEFKTAPDFSTSLGNLGEFSVPSSMALTPSWSSQDFEESTGSQSTPNTYKGISSAGVRHVPMKSKRKKIKSTSSSESLSTSSRHLRAAKSKAEYSEREAAATIAQAKQIQDYADREKDLQCE